MVDRLSEKLISVQKCILSDLEVGESYITYEGKNYRVADVLEKVNKTKIKLNQLEFEDVGLALLISKRKISKQELHKLLKPDQYGKERRFEKDEIFDPTIWKG